MAQVDLAESLIRNLWSFSDPSIAESTSLIPCGMPIIQLLLTICATVRAQNTPSDQIIRRLDDLILIAKQKFYAFPYKDVPSCWPELFRIASFLKASIFAMEAIWGKTASMISSEDMLRPKHHNSPRVSFPAPHGATTDKIVETIDTALIMAGHPREEAVRSRVEAILDLLGKLNDVPSGGSTTLFSSSPKRRKIDEFSSHSPFPPPSTQNPVPTFLTPPGQEDMLMSAFEEHMNRPRDSQTGPEPVVFKDLLLGWPASEKWKQLSYMKKKTIGGRRLVPVEIGKSYVDSEWGQKIIPFNQFLDEYLTDTTRQGKDVGYLAQYDLFKHVPALRNDIGIPDICYAACSQPPSNTPYTSEQHRLPKLEAPMLNAWFGPAGTVSPLHLDPYHNILAQVVGRKYVRLHPPREYEKLYPRGSDEGGVNMANTSGVDVGLMTNASDPDLVDIQAAAIDNFPRYKEADYMEVILEPGDALYIPLGWWHYVKSLTISFSVSFWFNDGAFNDESSKNTREGVARRKSFETED